MAIKKTFKDNKGVVTNYHRVGVFAFDATQGKLAVNLFGYADEEYRLIEKEDSTKQTDNHVSNLGVEFPATSADIFTLESIYAKIMSMPEFEGSESV